MSGMQDGILAHPDLGSVVVSNPFNKELGARMSQLKNPNPYTILIACGLLGLTGCNRSVPVVDVPIQPAQTSSPASSDTQPITTTTRPVTSANSGVSGSTRESSVRLNPRHPDEYVVKRGDTLWDISSMFLQDPWLWPEIWTVNPQVQNPHLIYPGDVLRLIYDADGNPRLVRAGVNRLSPRVRSQPLDDAISTIPYDVIGPFLSKPTVLPTKDIDQFPYIVSMKGHLAAGAGFEVYVRGLDGNEGNYNVVHVGDPLVDPDTNDVLGYNAIYVGDGRIRQGGDPATVFLTATDREALEGDRLIPAAVTPNLNFVPRSPSQSVEGRIIAIMGGVARVGQYQIVVMNRGANHGLEPGSVLSVYQRGEVVRDRVKGGFMGGEKVQLPETHAGELMVFRTYDRLSYGLIMRAFSEIGNNDIVRNP